MKLPALLAASLLVPAPCFAQYAFSSVDYPGAAVTRFIGINDHLEIVGHFILPGAGQVRHAVKYVHGQFEALDPDGALGSHESAATQINNRGDIGGWYVDGVGVRHGFVLRHGELTTIDYPGAVGFTQVNGVSDTGVIFGHFRDAALVFHGFRLDDGAFTQLDAPGAFSTFPFYLNTRGDIAGEYNERRGEIGHGFVLPRDGDWIRIDVPGAPPNSTLAIGINDRGVVLGYYRHADGQLRTFLVAVDDVASPDAYEFIALPGTGGTPETQNNAGVFVGFYSEGATVHGLVAIPSGRSLP
jgi:hypothetical protein